ncbi:hypothetical protein QWY14_03780 [Planococcus sp. N028]|uniref:Uncharacterized protein n=2 Tax=Planococcus shixiaomingii TaxID=3058393 RepID=A0ABT8MZN1_9BACL|nr:hypothetical protein [Planococcus sp. N028]
MLKSKISKLVGSIVWVFILVYGTAYLFRLLFGSYMLEGGMANTSYGILALLCAVPFVLIEITERRKKSTFDLALISLGLFSILFFLVHLVIVFSSEAMQDGAVTRALIVLPLSALLIVATVHFTVQHEKTS